MELAIVAELRVNYPRDRSMVCGALANAGYIVRQEARPREDESGTDWYVIIEERRGDE